MRPCAERRLLAAGIAGRRAPGGGRFLTPGDSPAAARLEVGRSAYRRRTKNSTPPAPRPSKTGSPC